MSCQDRRSSSYIRAAFLSCHRKIDLYWQFPFDSSRLFSAKSGREHFNFPRDLGMFVFPEFCRLQFYTKLGREHFNFPRDLETVTKESTSRKRNIYLNKQVQIQIQTQNVLPELLTWPGMPCSSSYKTEKCQVHLTIHSEWGPSIPIIQPHQSPKRRKKKKHQSSKRRRKKSRSPSPSPAREMLLTLSHPLPSSELFEWRLWKMFSKSEKRYGDCGGSFCLQKIFIKSTKNAFSHSHTHSPPWMFKLQP